MDMIYPSPAHRLGADAHDRKQPRQRHRALCDDSRDLGLPLRFPEPPATYAKISQGVTADLLAQALEWVSATGECAITISTSPMATLFRWEGFWPRTVDPFGMEIGQPQQSVSPSSWLTRHQYGKRFVRDHALQPSRIEHIANWTYLDGLRAPTWNDISHIGKARCCGFSGFADSEEAFLEILPSLRDRWLLP